jgi:hypothetical protein
MPPAPRSSGQPPLRAGSFSPTTSSLERKGGCVSAATLTGATAPAPTRTSVAKATSSDSDGERLRLIERLTRLGPDTIEYRFTVDDPTTWTKPWTAVVPIEKSDGLLYEFACHEGNYGLPNILSGARLHDTPAREANGRR